MMKKTLAILAALLILLAPLCAPAEAPDATAAPGAQAIVSESTGVSVPSGEGALSAAEDAVPAKGDQPLSFGESLTYLLKGMAGIFLVTGIIILAMVILEKAGGKKKDGQA